MKLLYKFAKVQGSVNTSVCWEGNAPQLHRDRSSCTQSPSSLVLSYLFWLDPLLYPLVYNKLMSMFPWVLWAGLANDSEKAMAPHSSTLAWKIPWMEKSGGLQSMGSGKSDTTEWLHFHFSLSCIGEGNGNPLQCSCLENPRGGRAWWASVSGVAQSRTQLKRLSSSSSSKWWSPGRGSWRLPIYSHFGQKLWVIWGLTTRVWHLKWGRCCGTEPLTCGIWCSLQGASVRTEGNCWTFGYWKRIGQCGNQLSLGYQECCKCGGRGSKGRTQECFHSPTVLT